ncbi:exportin-7 [Trichonephila clavipes]|nr:exportin-7 [Trichonephila clavipes]
MWYHDPAVTTPVLKLFAELVVNRSQRLQFDVSSPNGVLLFREASKVVVNYGISICFSMLKSALCGGYVNFGVFRWYGDVALDDALNTFVKMLLSIPQSDMLHYPKLSQTYYVLLECLAQDHMNFISSLEPQLFLYILSSISEGLTSSDTMVCAGCCAALDHLVTYIFKKISKVSRKRRTSDTEQHEEETCLRVLKQHPEILQQIDHLIGTSAHAPQYPMVRHTGMGTVDPGAHGLLHH